MCQILAYLLFYILLRSICYWWLCFSKTKNNLSSLNQIKEKNRMKLIGEMKSIAFSKREFEEWEEGNQDHLMSVHEGRSPSCLLNVGNWQHLLFANPLVFLNVGQLAKRRESVKLGPEENIEGEMISSLSRWNYSNHIAPVISRLWRSNTLKIYVPCESGMIKARLFGRHLHVPIIYFFFRKI